MVYDLTYYNTIIDNFCSWYVKLNTYLEILPMYKISPKIHFAHIQRFVKVNDFTLLSLHRWCLSKCACIYDHYFIKLQYFQIRRETMSVYFVYVCFLNYLNSLFYQEHKSTTYKLCFIRRYRPVYICVFILYSK